MNKTLKKVISIVLALAMFMSFSAIAIATDGEVDPGTEEQHRFIFQILYDIIIEIWEGIRYVFYDVFLGAQA